MYFFQKLFKSLKWAMLPKKERAILEKDVQAMVSELGEDAINEIRQELDYFKNM